MVIQKTVFSRLLKLESTMETKSVVARGVWYRFGLFSMFAFVVFPGYASAAEDADSGWKAWLGGGGVFYEADEPNESGQLYELRLGYDFNPRLTVEGGLGGAPFLEGNDFGAPDSREGTFGGKNSPGENWFVKPNLNLLYHFREDRGERVDPYLSIGGGGLYYGKRREDSNWEGYAGAGGGVAYEINNAWSVRGDYQLVAAGEDAQLNHYALIFVRYVWGEGMSGGLGSGREDGLGGPSTSPLQTIYFDFDKSSLTKDSKTKLQQNADWLRKNPDSDVSLDGHCDERGTNEYNMALGERRSRAAYDFLRSLGIPVDQMSTRSFGEEVPADPGHNESSWSKNRRVESVVK